MTPTIVLTPESYAASSDSAALADAVMEFAGINRDDCLRIELVNGWWRFELLCRNKRGQVMHDNLRVATWTTVWQVRP